MLTAESHFLNSRATQTGDAALLARLERFGELAARLYEVPDAGLWELRGTERVLAPDSLERRTFSKPDVDGVIRREVVPQIPDAR